MSIQRDGSNLLICPQLDKIIHNPVDHHNKKSARHIHRDNFLILINYVTSSDKEFQREKEISYEANTALDELFLLKHMTKYELALFILHTLELNDNKIDKEEINQIKSEILNRYTPPWMVNQNIIDLGFREIFLTTIELELLRDNEETLFHMMNQFSKFFSSDSKEDIRRSIETNTWSIYSLATIIDIISDLSNLSNSQELKSLKKVQESIENKLISLMIEYQSDWIKKSVIGFILLTSYISFGEDGFSSAQGLLDQLWTEWLDIKNDQNTVFRHIFLVFYSIVIKKFFDTSIQFPVRRSLVHSLMSKLNDDSDSFELFTDTAFTRHRIHPWLLNKMITGFECYLSVMINYLKELPESEERTSVEQHLEQVTERLFNLVVDHLVDHYGFVHPSKDVNLFVNGFELNSTNTIFKNSLLNFVSTSTNTMLLLEDNQINQSDKIFHLDLWLKLVQSTGNQNLLFLYELDILLLSNQYPFQPILEMIISEVGEDQSIMNSHTFEQRVIKIITQALQYLSETYEDTTEMNETAYEILLYFTAEWLQHFAKYKYLFADASGILSAVIIICFSHLSRFYFQKKEVGKAFLMYLNLYYFTEYLNHAIYEIPGGNDNTFKISKSVTDRFREMADEWNFNNLINLEVLTIHAKQIELSIKNTIVGEQVENVKNAMLADDLLFQYLDMTDALNEFIVKDMPNLSGNELDQLKSLSIYREADENSWSRISRIGSKLSKDYQLPIPLFRDIHKFSAAMSLLPVQIENAKFDDTKLSQAILKLLDPLE